MDNNIVVAINHLGHHEPLEVASWLCQIVLAITAMVSAILILFQVKEIARDSQKQTRQMHASFLFDLDKLFESEGFSHNRLLFNKMRQEVDADTEARFGHLDVEGRREKFTETFSIRLHQLKKENVDDYHHIMKLAGFFETAAVLLYKGLVEVDDIVKLYSSAIKIYYRATSLHIKQRQAAESLPEMFENFLRFGEELEKKAPKLGAP